MSRKKEPPPQFIAVTADEYELTLGAFDTVKEMCEWSGHKKFAIYQSMENGRVLRKGPAKGCKVLRLVNEMAGTSPAYCTQSPATIRNNKTACRKV